MFPCRFLGICSAIAQQNDALLFEAHFLQTMLQLQVKNICSLPAYPPPAYPPSAYPLPAYLTPSLTAAV